MLPCHVTQLRKIHNLQRGLSVVAGWSDEAMREAVSEAIREEIEAIMGGVVYAGQRLEQSGTPREERASNEDSDCSGAA